MQIEGYEFPDDLYYDLNYNWVRVEGNVAIQGDTFMSMESGKWVGRIFATVSGKITEANEEMEWDPTIINSAPYTDGWMAKIEMTEPSETGQLYRASDPEFQNWVKEETKRYV